MTKKNLYRYLGRNGTLSTFILLDGISHVLLYHLEADADKLLTNGEKFVKAIDIMPEELDNWYEVKDPGQNK